MTRPISASKLVLVADPRPVPVGRGAKPVRRYRLARLRFDRPADQATQFEYLGRVYD